MTLVEAIGWVLLHFVWQGAVIALVLAVLLALTRDGQARLRYALSCAALAMMLAATLVTAGTMTRVARNANAAADATFTAPESSRLTRDASDGPRTSDTARATRTALLVLPIAVGATVNTRIAQPIVDRAMPWLVLGWLAGVVLLTVRLLGGWWSSRAMRVVGISPVPEWCQAQLAALAARMRIPRPVAIVSSVRIAVPVILGHWKPVVVLPAAALSGLSPTQVEAILAHELAHVRRHDYLVNLAQTVIETLLFYHPAVWWVSGRIRETREHCCDDIAVAVCRSRRDYVGALLDLEELRGSTPALALAATGGSLLARGRRLLAPAQTRPSSPRLAASVIVLTVVTAAVAGASFSPASVPTWFEPEPAPETANVREEPAAVQRAAAATPVVMAPDTAAPLAGRWSWAEGAARSAGRQLYWIGYGVSPIKTLPPFIYNDRSSSVVGDRITFSGNVVTTDTAGLRFPGQPLAVPAGEDRTVKLLFGLDASRGEPRLIAVHMSTLTLPVDTKKRPVFWLGSAGAAESLDRIDQAYRSATSVDLKHDLVSAASVHDASPAVVAWLERRIASQDPDDVRGDAAEGIAWHPIAASIAALDRAARTDRSSRVRQEAAEALGDLAMPEAAPVLIALAQSLPDPDARREAVEALGARREPAASDALALIARQDKDPDIQREAVESLGDLEDKRGVEPLIELARTHPDVDVRREAIETLGEIGGAAAVGELRTLATTHADERVRSEAVESLGESDAPARETANFLKQLALTEKSEHVRTQALETLADLHDGVGVAALIDLARDHPSPATRRDALERLLESDHPTARAFFERALKKTPER